MAFPRVRNKKIHIQYWDPVDKNSKSRSTGLIANKENMKRAELIASKLQIALNEKYKKLKELGINKITLSEAFQHFLRNNQGKHPKTHLDYHRFYKKFTEKFDESKSCDSINKMNVEDWLNEIKKLPLAKNSIHGYGKQLVHFLNFLFEYNYTPMFKINRDVKTRPEVKDKIVFSDADLTLIFSGLEKKRENFVAAIYLLFYTGLRPSDILNITIEGIDLKQRILKYYSPKRKRYREIPFHKDLLKIIRTRISQIKVGKLIQYSSTESIGSEVLKYFTKLGLGDKDYSARTFRKTFITLCRSRFRLDASIVRELVGHEHGNTTDRYYNEIDIQTMKNSLDKFRRPVIKIKKRVT